MTRGNLTPKVQKLALSYLNRKISQTELRLYPYLNYCLKNFNEIDLRLISKEEKDILSQLEAEENLSIQGNKLFVTKQFYDYLQKVLAETYVETFY